MTKPLLHIEKLVKRFGGLTATDNADLSVKEGKIHAIIGPNGAGKTTLIAQISGAMPSDSGRITFSGHDVTKMPMDERARLGLVRSYQITSIFGRLSVLDNIALAIQAIEGSSFRFWSSARSEKERYEKAQAVAQRVGLSTRLNHLAQALSHGEQRQLEVGLALASRPKILLFDEPMAGMGPDETERMVRLLDSLRGETTVVLVEHDMDAVFKLADTISVLVFGKVIASGNAQEIKDNPSVKVAYLGDDFQHLNQSQVTP
ncbi:MAG: ABC transporter ATP-binding protein [Comamonadaceae bacterium]|nr:MAG: ABC transporter ATP-binding protein [Comamonadaceae bacterium]